MEDVISDKKLYPVTVLPSLPKLLLPELAKKNIILAQDLLTYSSEDMVRVFNITKDVADQLVLEVQGITEIAK